MLYDPVKLTVEFRRFKSSVKGFYRSLNRSESDLKDVDRHCRSF